MTTQMPQLRNKISISAGNTNRALRDIISPTSIGSYVESVEALKYGFYNTKISIMVDNWINGVQVNDVAERFTRRVIVYNRVNLATVIPAGAVVPTTSVAAAIAVLNSKYRLDLTEDDIEIKAGKVVAKPTSLGYYEEQDLVVEKTCASDRVNFFFSLAVKREETGKPYWVEGFIERFAVHIDGELHEVTINNSNNPDYDNRIKRAVLGLQQFFAGRSDIEMLVNFDTYANVNDPDNQTNVKLVPNITLVNKVTRDVQIEIYYQEHESMQVGLLPASLLKPMGSMLPACPISHRGVITVPAIPEIEGFDGNQRIKTIRVNNAVYSNIEETVHSTWNNNEPIFDATDTDYTTKLSRVFDVLGINNLLRIYVNASFKTKNDDNIQVPTFMIENITSEVVVIEFEMYDGGKYKLELGGDPRKDEPWFRRYFLPIDTGSMYDIVNGSYGPSSGTTTKVNGVEVNYDFAVTDLRDFFKWLIYQIFLTGNKIEVNLWEDVTGKDIPYPLVTVENLDTIAKTFEAKFPTDDGNKETVFKYLIPPMNLGPKGVVGIDLQYNVLNGDVFSRIFSDDNFLLFNRYHFSFDGVDTPDSEKQVDDPSTIQDYCNQLGPGLMMEVSRGEAVNDDNEDPFRAHFIGSFPQALKIYTRAKGGDWGATTPLNVITPIDINPVVYPTVWIIW